MAKERAAGIDAVLIGDFEASYGVPPAAGAYVQLNFKSSQLGADKPLIDDPLLGFGRDAQDPVYGAITNEGPIPVAIDQQAIGWWLKLLLGAPVTTGAGPYTHTYVSGGDLLSAALEIGHPALVSPAFYLNGGVKADTFTFDMSPEGPANAQVGLVAQSEAKAGTTQDAAPTAYSLLRFTNARGEIRLGGAPLGNVVGGTYSFTNGQDPVRTIRPDGQIEGADDGEAKATGTISVRFSNDTALENPIDAETPVSLVYEFTAPAGGNLLRFEQTRVFLPKKKKEIQGPQGVQVDYDWQASGSGVAQMTEVTLINDVAAY